MFLDIDQTKLAGRSRHGPNKTRKTALPLDICWEKEIWNLGLRNSLKQFSAITCFDNNFRNKNITKSWMKVQSTAPSFPVCRTSVHFIQSLFITLLILLSILVEKSRIYLGFFITSALKWIRKFNGTQSREVEFEMRGNEYESKVNHLSACFV